MSDAKTGEMRLPPFLNATRDEHFMYDLQFDTTNALEPA